MLFSFEWMLTTCLLIVKMSFEMAIQSHNNHVCDDPRVNQTNHSNCVWYKIGNLNPKKFNIITWYSNHNTYWNLKSTVIFKYFWKCSYRLDVCNIQQVLYFEGNKTIRSDSIVGQYSHLQDKTFSKSNVTLMFVLENMHTLSITQVWHLHTWTADTI